MPDTPPAHRLRAEERTDPRGARSGRGGPGRRSHGRRGGVRRWPRRLLLSANILVALVLIGAGSIYGYARYQLSSIHTINIPGLAGPAAPTANGMSPENILLIGNQTRAGLPKSMWAQFGSATALSGSLSDVIMILHLDPKTKKASILSIPRDLFAPMPAGSPVGPWQKIDAALNDGPKGPANLISAIHQDFGIPINHFVELNFLGFEQTVNALGGIRMYFPMQLLDQYTLLNVGPGCKLLNGQQALALVRSRHLQYRPPGVPQGNPAAWPYDPESDLARIVRDHEFLRVLITTAKAKGLTNPFKANAFLNAVINQVTMDPGLRNQLVSLASYYSNISSNLPETTLPVTVVNNYSYGGYNVGDVDFPVQPADNNVIAAWDHTALPTTVQPTTVNVYNAVGSSSLAAQTAAALKADGLPIGAVANAPVEGNPSETIVQYHPGQVATALRVFDKFSGAVILQPQANIPAGTVDVLVGSVEAVAGTSTTPTSPATTTAPAVTSPTSTGAANRSSSASVPVPAGSTVSSSADQLTPYDPRPCPPG